MCWPAPYDEATITVCVRDNGVGFDAARADMLFKPFSRLHGASYEGCGIGLSIVHHAVERLGGRVWADAAPGQGARFFFTLPPGPADDGLNHSRSPVRHHNRSPGGGSASKIP
jgi:signal transduction histidine kinase